MAKSVVMINMNQQYLPADIDHTSPYNQNILSNLESKKEIKEDIEDIEGPDSLTVADHSTVAETENLVLLLQQEARGRQKETVTTLIWSGAFVAIMLWLAAHAGGAVSAFHNFLITFVLMGGVGGAMCACLMRRSYRRKRSLTVALAHVPDRKQVALFIQALQVQNTSARNLAKHSLISLLPIIQASDASHFGTDERKILMRHLSISPNDTGYRDLTELFSPSAYRRELDLRLSILKALEQVGGEQELAVVERLSRGLPTIYSASKIPEELKAAARECVPFLQTRAHKQRASAELLRASSVHSSPGVALLRPTNSPTDPKQEQLLRASGTQS